MHATSSSPPVTRVGYHVVIIGVALAAYGALATRFWFVIDDAFITFRYSRNLASGLGIRYNAGETPPVEGYSNFLWMMLCAGFEWLRVDPVVLAPAVALLCGAALILLVHHRLAVIGVSLPAAAIGTVGLAAFPPVGLWGSTGLETMAFALSIYATFDALVLSRPRPNARVGVVAGIALCLMRVEGPAWAIVILLLACGARWLDGEWPAARRRLASVAGAIAAAFAVYFAWRYAYFGTLVSNTALAKAAVLSLRFERGVNYVIGFFLTFPATPLVILGGAILAARETRRGAWLAVTAMACAFPIYALVVTGDFMPMGRFLLPAAPFWALLTALLVTGVVQAGRPVRVALVTALGGALLAVQLAPAWNYHVLPRAWLERFRFRHNTPTFMTEFEVWQDQKNNADDWTHLGNALRRYAEQLAPAPRAPSVVLGAIGAAGYYSGLFVFDRHGLVTPRVARRALSPDEPLLSAGHDRRVAPEFFLDDEPTILRYRHLRGAAPDVAANAALRMAAELRALTQQDPRLAAYAPDLWRVEESVKDGRADYLIVWVRAEDDRATALWTAFEEKVRALYPGSSVLGAPVASPGMLKYRMARTIVARLPSVPRCGQKNSETFSPPGAISNACPLSEFAMSRLPFGSRWADPFVSVKNRSPSVGAYSRTICRVSGSSSRTRDRSFEIPLSKTWMFPLGSSVASCGPESSPSPQAQTARFSLQLKIAIRSWLRKQTSTLSLA